MKFWTATNLPELAQGDHLPNCLVPTLPDEFKGAGEPIEIVTREYDLIVVTQSCDLANMKTGLVALCPIYSLPEFEAVNPQFRKKGAWEEVRKGRREGLHLLASPINPSTSREALVVNFREIHSLPIGYLLAQAASINPRWRLQSPFLEHFSQAFARFFMRVGLPSTIPPFAD
jgi:hypothetical protein